jgi:1,2-phenylacetyl-CoA epoxidase catalytic subunit
MAEPETARDAFIQRLVINKGTLGQRYAEWGRQSTPENAAETLASMAEDETMQVRALAALLPDTIMLTGDPVVFLRQPPASWQRMVAVGFLFDTVLTVALATLADSADARLAEVALRVLRLEPRHAAYAEHWVRAIGGEGGPSAQGLEDALRTIWDDALCWLGPADDAATEALYARGIVDAMPEVWRARVLGQIGPVSAAAGLRLPLSRAEKGNSWTLTRPLPWERWNGQRWVLEATA